MDPVGPWSAYAASYNRLANHAGTSFQNAGSSAGPPPELHHPGMGGGGQGAPPASTSGLLAAAAAHPGLPNPSPSPFNPPGFLSPPPPPVGYDSVFTPLFHQKAHYGIQHPPPRPLKQPDSDPYSQNNPNNLYEQNIPWSQNNTQLPSPFGILPHESVATTSASQKSPYENYNAHFSSSSINQINSSFIDPKKRPLSPPKSSLSSATPFFQQMFTPPSESTHYKHNDYTKHFPNGQQAFNVPSPPNNQSKDYRFPQTPKVHYPQQRLEKPRAFTPKQIPQKITKPCDLDKRNNENDCQSSPISYAMMDAQRAFQTVNKMRPQQYQSVNINININQSQSYRFPMTPESEYQRSKSTESFGSSPTNPDCHVGLPRRSSPLHSQQSPSIPSQSPVYPAYNSPLTSISSPSPVQTENCYNNKPPTEINHPLDATRNISTLARNDVRYDRPDYSQWDERNRHMSSYETINSQQRPTYYNNQVPLQDLSSCRGDPMSLVKNLQQPLTEKPEKAKTNKKRTKKSDKKAASSSVDKVPPPAHVNPNGYLDTRWNENPPTEKTYSSPTTEYSAQTNVTPPTQPSTVLPQTQQNTPPVAVNYYPNYESGQSQTTPSQAAPETPETPEAIRNQPRVIVPDIAEELQILLSTDLSLEMSRRFYIPERKHTFLSSFEKFLRGEKDPSSSPPTKKSRRVSSKNTLPDVPDLNIQVQDFPSDPQDDPRYYPLPKSTHERNFNSSDSEVSESKYPIQNFTQEVSCDNLAENSSKKCKSNSHKKKKKKSSKKKKKKSKRRDSTEKPSRPGRKARSSSSYRHSDKSDEELKNVQESPASDSNLPEERERTRRKATKKSCYEMSDVSDEDRLLKIPELHQSDDPSWSPDEVSEDLRRKRSRRLARKRQESSSYLEGSSSSSEEDEGDSRQSESLSRRQLKTRRISISDSMKPSDKSQKKSTPQIICPLKMKGSKSHPFPFNIGEFVFMKSDTLLKHPPIWKVTEKAMLQKFLHFVEKGMSFYHNLRFFTGWNPESNKICEGVVVKVILSNKQETKVELLTENLQELEQNERVLLERIFDATACHLESFEIYVQTLFSQALDSNFLNEIYQEQDEYFLENVRVIESVVSDLERRLIEVIHFPEEALLAIQSFSSYRSAQKGGKTCHCGTPAIQLISLTGMTYSKETLEVHLLSSPTTQDVTVCRSCLTLLEVLHGLSHFKQYIFALCEVKVNDRKEEDMEKDQTIILNEMLADDGWILQLFKKVRRDWGYAEVLIANLQRPSSSQTDLKKNLQSNDNIFDDENSSSHHNISRDPLALNPTVADGSRDEIPEDIRVKPTSSGNENKTNDPTNGNRIADASENGLGEVSSGENKLTTSISGKRLSQTSSEENRLSESAFSQKSIISNENYEGSIIEER